MKIYAVLTPNNKKNLNDNIYDIIDNHITDNIQKAGVKAAYWTFNIFGDNGSNALFSLAKSKFEGLIKGALKNNHIFANVRNIILIKSEEKLNVSIEIVDIDYFQSIIKNKQRIIDGLKNLSPNNVVWDILNLLQDDTDVMLSTILKTIDDKKKEAIIKILLNQFDSTLCSYLTKILNDNKIGLAVKNIKLD